MIENLAIPLSIAMLMGSGFIVNEWSEGALAQTMGMDHHHMSSLHTHCDEMERVHGDHGTMGRHMHPVSDCPRNDTKASP